MTRTRRRAAAKCRERVAVSCPSAALMSAALSAALMILAGCGGDRPVARSVTATAQPPLAGLPSATSLSAPGPAGAAGPGPRLSAAVPAGPGTAPGRAFAVRTRTFAFARGADRLIRTAVWYPEASGRFPAIVFSHGLNGRPEDFAPLLNRWAAAGFVIIAPAYPHTARAVADFEVADVLNQPADASYVLTQVLGGPLGSRIDAGRLAAAGHSAGAITTVGLFTKDRDVRLRAGVVLAGNAFGVGDGFTGPAATLLFVHGDADPLVSYASGRAAFDRVPWSKALLTLPGQAHGDPYLAPSTKAYAVVAATTLDFLRFTLYADPAARGRLGADAAGNPLDNRLTVA